MVLYDDYIFRVMDGHHCLSVLRSLHLSTDLALQSLFDQIRTSYFSRADGTSLSGHDIFMLSRHNNSFSAKFTRDTRFINLAHCVMKYARTFKLEYNVQFLQALTADISHDIQSS